MFFPIYLQYNDVLFIRGTALRDDVHNYNDCTISVRYIIVILNNIHFI